MKIAVIGTGYVGLVTGACLAEFGLSVLCADCDNAKIMKLNEGIIPIYEPGLEDIVKNNCTCGRLKFTSNIKETVEGSDVIFITVGTPSADDGSVDLQYVMQAAKDIGTHMNGYKVIVDKSTVPVGTGKKVKQAVEEILSRKGGEYRFDVVSNPEFLREGSAVSDFMHPDRIVLGVESEDAEMIMKEVYGELVNRNTPIITANIETAEVIKYASNAFLALKITYINEIANLCERVGADAGIAAKAVGMDKRIGPKFLNPGPGYGGSCFPKDTRALSNMGHKYGSPVTLVDQVITANEGQKQRMVEKIRSAIGNIKDKKIAVLGITFKPDTDDMREAPSLVILKGLAEGGAYLNIYDPEGMKEGRLLLKDIEGSCTFCEDEYAAAWEADAVVIITEWERFKRIDLDRIKKSMRSNYFFDLRNIFDRSSMEQKGFRYYGVGR